MGADRRGSVKNVLGVVLIAATCFGAPLLVLAFLALLVTAALVWPK
jgi:hypothetical protein